MHPHQSIFECAMKNSENPNYQSFTSGCSYFQGSFKKLQTFRSVQSYKLRLYIRKKLSFTSQIYERSIPIQLLNKPKSMKSSRKCERRS